MICDAKWEDDRASLLSYKRYRETYVVNFPGQDIHKLNFHTPEDITNYLIKQATAMGYYKDQLFDKKSVLKDGVPHYIYSCNRQNCEAMLEYRKKGGMLTLQKFKTTHAHKIKLTPKKAKTEEIRQYLMDLPAEDNIQFHIQAVKSKFGLSKQQAKYIKGKLFWKCDTEEELLEKLTQKNVTFRRHLEGEKTIILLICTESMKSNYRKYGDLLCFDITYKLLKKKRKETKHLGVGFFVGQDENTRIVLFGMCTIARETTEYFMKLFSFFFEVMEQRIPETILTDDQRTIGLALENLKKEREYKYHHMLDWYHKIEGIKKRIKRQYNNSVLFPLFCRILKEPSTQIYKDIIYEIASFLKKEEIMLQFLKEQHKYCLSQVPPSFFGFGVSSTRAQSMNNLIKRSVSHQTNLGKLVFFTIRVEQRLINNMKNLNQTNRAILTNIRDQQILKLSLEMEHLAFDQIRQYFQASRELELVEIDSLTYQVPYEKYDRPYRFIVQYDIESRCWRCECCAIFKTGMPCAHLIRVIRKFKGSITYYINARWFHCKENPHLKKMSRPPIAKNRRRI